MMSVGDAVLALGGLIALWVLWRFTHWSRRGVPSLTPLPFVGNVLEAVQLRKSVGFIMSDIYKQMEGKSCVGVYRFSTPALLLRDPDLVEEVLLKNFASFHDNEIQQDDSEDPFLYINPFSTTQNRWKDLRVAMSAIFSPEKVRGAYSVIEAKAKEMVRYLSAMEHRSGVGDGVDVKELGGRYTSDIAVSIAFGLDGHGFSMEKPPFLEAGARVFGSFWMANLKLTLYLVFPSVLNRLKLRFVTKEVQDYFIETLKESLEKTIKEGSEPNDFFNAAQDLTSSQTPIDKSALVDSIGRIILFLLEGMESISTTLASTLGCLTAFPETQVKLRKELQQAFPDGNVQVGKLDSLQYLDNVLKESVRLLEGVPIMTRVCTAPTTLYPKGQKPINVAVGTPIIIPINALHHDPKHYPSPQTFDPDRFQTDSSRHPFTYMPFGGGRRTCVGMKMARTELKAAVAAIVLNFDLEASPKQKLPPRQDVRLPLLALEGGMWLRFIKRNPSNHR